MVIILILLALLPFQQLLLLLHYLLLPKYCDDAYDGRGTVDRIVAAAVVLPAIAAAVRGSAIATPAAIVGPAVAAAAPATAATFIIILDEHKTARERLRVAGGADLGHQEAHMRGRGGQSCRPHCRIRACHRRQNAGASQECDDRGQSSHLRPPLTAARTARRHWQRLLPIQVSPTLQCMPVPSPLMPVPAQNFEFPGPMHAPGMNLSQNIP